MTSTLLKYVQENFYVGQRLAEMAKSLAPTHLVEEASATQSSALTDLMAGKTVSLTAEVSQKWLINKFFATLTRWENYPGEGDYRGGGIMEFRTQEGDLLTIERMWDQEVTVANLTKKK